MRVGLGFLKDFRNVKCGRQPPLLKGNEKEGVLRKYREQRKLEKKQRGKQQKEQPSAGGAVEEEPVPPTGDISAEHRRQQQQRDEGPRTFSLQELHQIVPDASVSQPPTTAYANLAERLRNEAPTSNGGWPAVQGSGMAQPQPQLQPQPQPQLQNPFPALGAEEQMFWSEVSGQGDAGQSDKGKRPKQKKRSPSPTGLRTGGGGVVAVSAGGFAALGGGADDDDDDDGASTSSGGIGLSVKQLSEPQRDKGNAEVPWYVELTLQAGQVIRIGLDFVKDFKQARPACGLLAPIIRPRCLIVVCAWQPQAGCGREPPVLTFKEKENALRKYKKERKLQER